MQPTLHAIALQNFPMVQTGDDVLQLLIKSLNENNWQPQDNDIIVIASKIFSKSQGRYVSISSVTPSQQALELAEITGKDPKIVEIILSEASSVSRTAPNVMVTEHRLGFVSANSGIDQSNVGKEDTVLILPENPDADAQELRKALQSHYSCQLGVVISDTHGRPFRLGNVGVAIGVAGIPALLDQRGEKDLFGRELKATVQGYADMVASTAHLLSGEGAEGRPVVCLRGLSYPKQNGNASDLYRDPKFDLYR